MKATVVFAWLGVILISAIGLVACQSASTSTAPSNTPLPPIVSPTADAILSSPTIQLTPTTPSSPTAVTTPEFSPTDTFNQEPFPLSTLPPDIPILEEGGLKAAGNLVAEVGCADNPARTGFAALQWSLASEPGVEQRVVITIYKNGFESGLFEVSEPLPPDQDMLVWEALHGQSNHFWRVLTLHVEGWVPSETSSFSGPTCISDFPQTSTP